MYRASLRGGDSGKGKAVCRGVYCVDAKSYLCAGAHRHVEIDSDGEGRNGFERAWRRHCEELKCTLQCSKRESGNYEVQYRAALLSRDE